MFKNSKLLTAALLVASVVLPSVVSYAEPKTHDGFYLRLSPGVAATGAGTELENEDTLGVGGLAGYFGFGVGYAVTRNILVGFASSSQVVVSPTVSLNDETTETDDDVSWGLHLVGAEAIYYIDSVNVFLGAAVGAMVMTVELPEEDGRSEIGFGTQLSVGKEFWVAPEVGVGLSLQTTLGAIPDDDLDWGAIGFGAAVSVTIN